MENDKLTDEMFSQMTQYCHLTNDKVNNVKRARQLGIDKENTQVAPGAQVRIPKDQIGENVFLGLYSYFNGDVTIGNNVLIGPHCSIVASNHAFDPETGWFSGRTESAPVVIGDGCWIASNVTITPGVSIGKANLICAGSVITKSTPDYAIMAGVPAKQIGSINKETGEYTWFK